MMKRNPLYLVGLIIGALLIGGCFYYFFDSQKAKAVDDPLQVFLFQRATNELEKPALPDISNYTVDAIEEQAIAALKTPTRVQKTNQKPQSKRGSGLPDIAIVDMKDSVEFREFIKKDGRAQIQRLSRMEVRPKAILLRNGSYDFVELYAAIKNQASEELPLSDIIIKEGSVYTLRMPLLVGPGATMRISGDSVQELRLSRDRATFLANAGYLYIIKTRIVGWDEAKKTASHYIDPKSYRPFIVSWGGGKLLMADCRVESLGYDRGKSYGLTYSTCKECLEVDPTISRPTGVLVGNKFVDMYYGFYSYEADDVVIVGNEYINNQIYAIDPHDRSRRLIIARNKTHGTKEKHGIIISREVNDSWIFENHSHHNSGSGIMIDRSSINNIIAHNVSEHNDQDGLTFFESESNRTWNNRLLNNKRNGIKARNSWDLHLHNDTIVGNGAAPVNIYTSDMTDQAERNFSIDPFTQHAGAEIIGANIKSNTNGAIKLGALQPLMLSKVFITPATTPIFSSNKIPNNIGINQMLRTGKHQIYIQPKSAPAPDGELLAEIKALE